MALANHRKAIRTEIARYAERFRAAQLEAVTTALAALGMTDDELPPIVALLMMTGVTQVLALEDALGVTAGHDTTRSFIEQRIAGSIRRPPTPDMLYLVRTPGWMLTKQDRPGKRWRYPTVYGTTRLRRGALRTAHDLDVGLQAPGASRSTAVPRGRPR